MRSSILLLITSVALFASAAPSADNPVAEPLRLYVVTGGHDYHMSLQDDGSIYWPIANSTPAEGQNARLLPYAGRRVTATGKVYARAGSQALVIETISAASK